MNRGEEGTERTCIVTRRKGAPETMIRFVVGPGEAVVPDIRRRLPGRGLWVAAHLATIEQAVRRRAFDRAFKAKVNVDPALAATVGEMLDRDALQSLAMANKAGVVTTGFAKVEAALAAGTVAALLHATDGGDDGIRKLEAAARRHGGGSEPPCSLKLFSSRELDLALGRTNVIHAALAVGPASTALLTRLRRSILYREGPAQPEADAKAASV